MENKMVKATLLLHYYDGEQFLGQKLLWVELKSTFALGVLIDLLAKACRPDRFYGTEWYPTSSTGYKALKDCLERAFLFEFSYDNLSWSSSATSIRVMQIMEGQALPSPRIPEGF